MVESLMLLVNYRPIVTDVLFCSRLPRKLCWIVAQLWKTQWSCM